MIKIKKFFNDMLFYLSSNFFANFLNFITGIVVRRILEPAIMGLFNEIMLIFDYARYSHMGIIDALDREMPYFYGKKDYEKVERLKDTGFTICLIVSLLISIGIFIATWFIKLNGNNILVGGVRIVSLMIVLRFITSLYIVLNRSRNRFSVISKYTIFVAVLDIVFKIFLTIKFGLYGLLWASLLTLGIGLLYFYKASGEKLKFIFNFPFKEVVCLLKIGFPLLVMGIVFMTLTNIDRIMIIRLLDRENLGFYTIALMVNGYIAQLPSLVYGVFFPRFYQAYGEKQDIFEIKKLFMKPTLIFAYLFPILIGLVIIILPLLIHYVLPAYIPGLIPTYFLLFESLFIALASMPIYLLVALNKQIYIVLIGTMCIFLGVGLNYLFVKKFDLGLSGIAIGTSLVYFIYVTILIAYSYSKYTKKVLSHLGFFIKVYLPFFWILILLWALRIFTFRASGNIYKDFYIVFYKGIVFLLSCLPLILYANKKTGILTLAKDTYFLRKDEASGI